MKTNNTLTSPQRERTSVAIQGLDLSTPDDTVKDGSCSELHNLRYKDNAWRPVRPFMGTSVNYTGIVYHHPVAGYITLSQSGSNFTFKLNGSSTIQTFKKEQKLSHFGNILIFESEEGISYYTYSNGVYTAVSFPDPATTEVNYASEPITPDYTYNPSQRVWKTYDKNNVISTYYHAWRLYNHTTGTSLIPLIGGSENRKWYGEIAYFLAYRFADGTELLASNIDIISSEGGNNYSVPPTMFDLTTYGGLNNSIDPNDSDIYTYYIHNKGVNSKQLQYILPSLKITVPAGINSELITSIAVYSTRVYPMLSLSPVNSQDFGQLPSPTLYTKPAYAKNKLVEQPFYRIKEFDLKSGTSFTLDLSSDIMQNIEVCPLYTPNNNIHTFISRVSLDYNNRRHISDIKLVPYKGYKFLTVNTATSIGSFNSYYSLKVENVAYTFHAYRYVWNSANISLGAKVISYPDYRVYNYILQYFNGQTITYSSTLNLTSAIANNLAYYLPNSTATEKYPNISIALEGGGQAPNRTDFISFPNRIQVSSANNCFSFPFENTYAVGSSNNKIIAMQSAAIKIGDEQVGALPLYVFTEEGIFALRAGESTLYAAVNPINYDKVINPSTLAINGAVAYITEQGVHLLTNEGSTVISAPIHEANGMPNLNFLRTCVFLHSKQFDELILYKSGESKAFVYNLNHGYWSTRDVSGEKINTDELVDSKTIYDINNEDEEGALDASIITRPIKLGNVEYKRVDSLIPRLSVGGPDVNAVFSFDGSTNGSTYDNLRNYAGTLTGFAINPIVLRRTPFSAKYFKVKLNLSKPDASDGFSPSITHIDFEWYSRYVRRMR